MKTNLNSKLQQAFISIQSGSMSQLTLMVPAPPFIRVSVSRRNRDEWIGHIEYHFRTSSLSKSFQVTGTILFKTKEEFWRPRW